MTPVTPQEAFLALRLSVSKLKLRFDLKSRRTAGPAETGAGPAPGPRMLRTVSDTELAGLDLAPSGKDTPARGLGWDMGAAALWAVAATIPGGGPVCSMRTTTGSRIPQGSAQGWDHARADLAVAPL